LTIEHYLPVAGLAACTVILNLPFGYLRVRAKKFSLRWILCIHLPIPLVYFLRETLVLESFNTPLFVAVTLLGQWLGGKIDSLRKE
jgi:hypothetical protein